MDLDQEVIAQLFASLIDVMKACDNHEQYVQFESHVRDKFQVYRCRIFIVKSIPASAETTYEGFLASRTTVLPKLSKLGSVPSCHLP